MRYREIVEPMIGAALSEENFELLDRYKEMSECYSDFNYFCRRAENDAQLGKLIESAKTAVNKETLDSDYKQFRFLIEQIAPCSFFLTHSPRFGNTRTYYDSIDRYKIAFPTHGSRQKSMEGVVSLFEKEKNLKQRQKALAESFYQWYLEFCAKAKFNP